MRKKVRKKNRRDKNFINKTNIDISIILSI